MLSFSGFPAACESVTLQMMVPPTKSAADQKGMRFDYPSGVKAAAAPATVCSEQLRQTTVRLQDGKGRCHV